MFSRIIISVLPIVLLNVVPSLQAQSLPSTVPPIAPVTVVAAAPNVSAPIAPTAFIAEPTNVLVLPFQQLGGQEINAWIGLALQQNFAAEAARNPALRALAMANVPPTIDVDVAMKTAKNAGAPIVIFGSYEVMDTDVRIMGYLMDVPTGHIFSAIKTSGPVRTLFVMEDRLDEQLNQALERQVPAAAAAKALETQRAAILAQPVLSNPPPMAPVAAQVNAGPINASAVNTLPPVIYSTPESISNAPYYPEYPAVPPYTSSIYATPTYAPDTYYPDLSLNSAYSYGYPVYPLIGFGFGFNSFGNRGFGGKGFSGGGFRGGGGFGGGHGGGHR